MNRLGPLLMQRLDQLLEFADFNSSIELDYLQIARCLEAMHKQCRQLHHELQEARKQLRQSESERLGLEERLKRALNQVQVEMKKRHGAEAKVEKQERKLKLIYDYLMDDSQITHSSKDQCSALAAFDWQCFSHSTLLPGSGKCCVPKLLSTMEEPDTSILSDISFNHSDDEMDLSMRTPPKGKGRKRSSLTPLIHPVVAAKRARPSLAASSNAVMTQRSGVIAESGSSSGHHLIPIAATSHRRSQLNRWASTNSDLTTIWGSTDDSGGCNSQAENGTVTGAKRKDTEDPFTTSPSQGTSTLQEHHFTSKMVIRRECCAVCKSHLRFGKMAFRCRLCQLLVHPECKERLAPCTPGAHPSLKEGILADFAPHTPPLIPPIVIQCVNQVEKRGLQETGLYRVPGAEHLVREWKNKLLSAWRAPPSLDHVADVNVICGILKDFLRNLKEPLITFYLHSAFLHAAEIPDESTRHTALCHVVMKLPLANRHTLAFLMLHLHRVIQSPECRMDQHNLARIFGPTLVGHGTPNPAPLTIMEDTPRQCLVVSRLLALPLKFWKRFVGEEQEILVPSVQQMDGMNEQEWLFSPLSSPKSKHLSR